MLVRLQWKPLLWTFLHLLLLLSLFSPLVVLTASFLLLPLVVLYVQLPLRKFIIHYAAGLIVLVILLRSIGFIDVAISLFFLPTAVVMGTLYKKKVSARRVLITSTLILLGQLLLTMLIISLFGFNVITEMKQFMRESLDMLPSTMAGYLTEDTESKMIDWATQLLPLYFICFSGYFAVVTHAIARKVLNRSGAGIPGLRPAREWMLPRSLVWYYMAALAVDLFTGSQTDTMITMILWNLIPLLTLAFSIQAVAFLFFIAHERKWNRTLPIAGMVAVIVFPFVQYIFSVLGVLDVAFPIRERMLRNK